MSFPEEKYCPRCNKIFECKVNHIEDCQCSGISIPEEVRNIISAKYDDCLCRNCLLELKEQYTLSKDNTG